MTIHYKGKLANEGSIALVERLARDYSSDHKCPIRSIDRDDESATYTGIALFPHPDCESFYLVFDNELGFDDYVKTQFAGPDIHISLLDLLRAISEACIDLKVFDEGEYWDTNNRATLERHMTAIRTRIEEQMQQFPGSRMQVRDQRGRIIDLQRARTPEAAAALAEMYAKSNKSPKKSFWKRIFH